MKTLLLILFLLSIPVIGSAQDRVAFIVGNSIYEHAPPLPNPTNDAFLIARTLRELGFRVDLHENLSRLNIAARLSDFLDETQDAELTLFYFAGHGMQFGGKNFLLGTDARLRSELDIEAEALNLDHVTRLFRRGSRAALVFVDACRDNPLATTFYRESFSPTRALANRGLAAPKLSFEGAMLTFAASPGQVAFDGPARNSPFAEALAKHLPTPGVEILTLMKRVTRDVKHATGERQVPMVNNDLTREIYLKGEDIDRATELQLVRERELFKAATELGTLRAWDVFLKRYPKGQLYASALAERKRVAAKEKALAAAVSVPNSSERTTEIAALAPKVDTDPDVAAKRLKVLRKYNTRRAWTLNEPVNRPQQVILRDVIFQRKLVEQGRLRFLPRSHHRQSPHSLRELNQPLGHRSSRSFSTVSAHSWVSLHKSRTAAVGQKPLVRSDEPKTAVLDPLPCPV